jgi:SOS-response transcriptional repressor LexA
MSTFGLTRVQRETMLIIQELSGPDGLAPSFDEIAHELGLASKSGIVRLVDRLVERGHLARIVGKARSLKVLKPVPVPEDCEIVNLFDDPDLAACLTGKRHVAP